jgi:hypothetical protein
MLRVSDQGIPPHMLHLYETNDAQSSKSKEFNDDAIRLPSALMRIGIQVKQQIQALRGNTPTKVTIPDSAKKATAKSCEKQYLGESNRRDTRWNAF